MSFEIKPQDNKKVAVTGVNTKRKILIVEDNIINQELLKSILEGKYDIITADNGADGLKLLKQHYKDLSLILLDVYMPVCNGFEFLESIKDDALLASVPVVVTTGSENPQDEIKCLEMGVYDFVTKPYKPEIALARIEHIIRFKESLTTLSFVENDSLTGLYTMQAFIHKVEKLLSLNQEKHFDLLLADLEDFKLVNDTFGEETGDNVLVEVSKVCRNMIPSYAAARDGDKFYFLCDCVEGIDEAFVEKLNKEINASLMIPSISIKYGLYHNVDAKQSVSSLCDRVNIAIEGIKHNYNKNLAFYDESLRKHLIENQKMEADFIPALESGEFFAWYQPKVDVRTEKIVAAEALVRWIPQMGRMISPASFIPLFERNGEIADLDEYIYNQVCCLQRERINNGQRVVPISVNLSRNSIYRNDIVERYLSIAKKYDMPLHLVPLELTESATTEGKVIQSRVESLIKAGFEVHMDDFGTGYSSIASLTKLAFSVIKLDKSIIDQIGYHKGDILMKYLIAAAHDLGMEVIAEGVEEQYQIDFLKEIGCNIIQGYYYSPPKNLTIFKNMLDADEKLGKKG